MNAADRGQKHYNCGTGITAPMAYTRGGQSSLILSICFVQDAAEHLAAEPISTAQPLITAPMAAGSRGDLAGCSNSADEARTEDPYHLQDETQLEKLELQQGAQQQEEETL